MCVFPIYQKAIIYFIEHPIERILTAALSVCIVSAEKTIKQLHGLQKAF